MQISKFLLLIEISWNLFCGRLKRDKIINYQHDLNKTWKVIKNLLIKFKKDVIPNIFEWNGNSIDDNENVANAFNHYFTNIGSELASKIPSSNRDFNTYFPRSFNSSFGLFNTDQTGILSIYSNLNVKNSTGYDNIPSNIAKESIRNIVDPLVHIINSSFGVGIVPRCLKVA